MKAISIIWAIGSISINIIVGIYLFSRRNMPAGTEEAYQHLNENIGIFRCQWQAEYLVMTALFICALQWTITSKKIWWTITTVGLAITLGLYPLMLGGYFNTSPEFMNGANQQGIYVFGMGSFIFFLGLALLYLNDRLVHKTIRMIAVALSAFAAIAFLGLTLNLITWSQFILFGPPSSIVYLINAWYGIKSFQMYSQGQSEITTEVPVEVQVSP